MLLSACPGIRDKSSTRTGGAFVQVSGLGDVALNMTLSCLCHVAFDQEGLRLPTLTEAAVSYRSHLVAKGRAPGTAQDRFNTVRRLVATVGDVQVNRTGPDHVDRLFAAHPNWSVGTRNNQVTNLNLFFKWCRFRKFMPVDSDPMFGWERLTYTNPERVRIPVASWPRLFAACKSQVETVTIATGLYLFLRASEQRAIQLRHVHLDRNEIEIHRVKTRSWDTMPISSELEPHLRQHLTWLATFGATDPNHFLIPARTRALQSGPGGFVKGSNTINPTRPFGRPYQVVQGVLERAGFDTFKEGEHTLRRSGARAYFDALVAQGYDGALRRVMSMLGHKNSKMTEHYLGLDVDRHRRNDDLRGRPMFPDLDQNVVRFERVSNGS